MKTQTQIIDNRELSGSIDDLLREMSLVHHSTNPVPYASHATEAFWLVQILENKFGYTWSVEDKQFRLYIDGVYYFTPITSTTKLPRAIAETCYKALLKEKELNQNKL